MCHHKCIVVRIWKNSVERLRGEENLKYIYVTVKKKNVLRKLSPEREEVGRTAAWSNNAKL